MALSRRLLLSSAAAAFVSCARETSTVKRESRRRRRRAQILTWRNPSRSYQLSPWLYGMVPFHRHTYARPADRARLGFAAPKPFVASLAGETARGATAKLFALRSFEFRDSIMCNFSFLFGIVLLIHEINWFLGKEKRHLFIFFLPGETCISLHVFYYFSKSILEENFNFFCVLYWCFSGLK